MDEDHFIVYKSGSLQKMAGHTVALNIWHGYISRSAYYKDQHPKISGVLDDLGNAFELCVDFQLECNELVKSLQIPESIENILMKSLKNIQTEMDVWIYGFKNFVFDEDLERYKYRVRRIDLNCCVWTPDCKIDYVKTASKMLFMAELSKVQKFIIMCKFCLENEIWDFPYHSLHWKTVNLLYSDPVLEYWMCKLEDDEFSMEMGAMVLFCCDYNDYAASYFWEFLSDERQVIIGALYLLSGSGRCQLKLLSKMSDSQQKQLICHQSDVIIKNFLCWLDMPENAIVCWVKTKDLMTEEAFHELVFSLLCHVGKDDKTTHAEKCHAFLLYVWDTAPDRLKNHMLEMSFDYIVNAFFHEFHNHSTSSLEFVRCLLSVKSSEYRRSFMLENAIAFVTRVPVLESNLTAGLIEFCLPNIDDRMEFRKLIMTSDGAFKESYQSLF